MKICCLWKARDFVKHFGLAILQGEKGIGIQPVAGSALICRNVPPRSLFKSSLNTSFHPHPSSLFLGAMKCFVRHGKKENETCTALLLEEVLPLTHEPWFQLFLDLARLGFQKQKVKKIPKPNQKNIKNPSTSLNKTFQTGFQRHSSAAEHWNDSSAEKVPSA